MTDTFILTPYFIDEPTPGLRPLAQTGWQVNDRPLADADDKQRRLGPVHQALAALVAEAAAQGHRPVSIAGDCCTTLAFTAGLQRAGRQPTLIWFDAHGDFNTWETTPSGFLGGMPLAMLVGRGEQTMGEAVGLQPLDERRVILTDGRDLDPGERELVAGSEIVHLPDVQQLLDSPLPDGPLYVHFDVDVLNTDTVPAVSYPAPGGPTAEELAAVFRRLAGTGRVTAVSLSAWNPELPGADRSQAACLDLLAILLGA